MAVKRGDVKPPVLPKEAVQVDAIGGEVVVCGLLMSAQMAITAQIMQASEPRDGETEEAAKIRARAQRIALTLAPCVLADDGKPLWTAAEWDVFGNRHPQAALDLFHLAQRLNGQDDEATLKNS
jgi:hypothetical protein